MTEREFESKRLLDAAVEWAEINEMAELTVSICACAVRVIPSGAAALFLDDGADYRLAAWRDERGDEPEARIVQPHDAQFAGEKSSILTAASSGQPTHRNRADRQDDDLEDWHWDEDRGRQTDRILSLPLRTNDTRCIGVLRLHDPDVEAVPEHLLHQLATLAGHAIKELATEDQLTGQVDRLTRVGIALTNVRDPDELLYLIVDEARKLANCDGGTVFTREGEELALAVWQNQTLKDRGEVGAGITPRGQTILVGPDSVAGHVAAMQKTENISDAYHLPPEAGYSLDRTWDLSNRYRTRSVLCVPMVSPEGKTIGVLQLINALTIDGQVIDFPQSVEHPIQCLASQAAVALRNNQLHQQLLGAYFDTILRLSVAAEYRDKDTGNHIQRMSRYAEVIARNLGLSHDQCELIRLAAPMHDIGKLGVPDSVLLKPGRLTEDEWASMREHTNIGAKILADSNSEVIQLSSVIARTHHEKWDGSGYPNGLAGEGIPLEGRIVALADAFDCICSARVYKSASTLEEALAIMQADSGTHFDPTCVEAFMAGLEAIRVIHLAFGDRGLESDS